jgi:sugar phosphate isomerase/epimerase
MPSSEPRLPLGLCLFGLTYTVGRAGAGTPRANPRPMDPLGFLDLAAELGLSAVETPSGWLAEWGGATGCETFAAEARARGLTILYDRRGLAEPDEPEFMDTAERLGARLVRCTLSGVLCGRRARVGGLSGWQKLLDGAARRLAALAPELEARGLRLAVENHQDADSRDLVWLCEAVGSPAVGVTLDTGNPLAVGEDILAFLERVRPYLFHAHLKDYRLFHRPDGYCLARCADGEGVVPFAELLARCADLPGLLPSVELAALEGRAIPVLDDAWWADLGERDLAEALPVFRLWFERGQAGDGRTPWELGEDDRLMAWELDQVRRSVAHLRAIWPGGHATSDHQPMAQMGADEEWGGAEGGAGDPN